MSAEWVTEVLSALGVEVVKTERSRVWALCPYHQKPDDPRGWATTFFVRTGGKRRDKEGRSYSAAGQHHCFACDAGGSMRALVMRVRGCDEEEAKRFIKKRRGPGGSKVEELRRVVTVVRRERLGRVGFRIPPEVIFDPLDLWVSGAREELLRRGVTADEVREFGIGYAVDGRKLGGRVVVPWRDGAGRIGSYTARTFVDEEPKYTTPGPEENPDREVVFGEHLWPADARDRDVVVISEGAFNAMAARRVLPAAAIGAVGGANNFDSGQARKLATFRRGLVVSDPDPAGDKLARDLELSIGRYVRLARAELPRGKDAEDAGPEALLRALERALRLAS